MPGQSCAVGQGQSCACKTQHGVATAVCPPTHMCRSRWAGRVLHSVCNAHSRSRCRCHRAPGWCNGRRCTKMSCSSCTARYCPAATAGALRTAPRCMAGRRPGDPEYGRAPAVRSGGRHGGGGSHDRYAIPLAAHARPASGAAMSAPGPQRRAPESRASQDQQQHDPQRCGAAPRHDAAAGSMPMAAAQPARKRVLRRDHLAVCRRAAATVSTDRLTTVSAGLTFLVCCGHACMQ